MFASVLIGFLAGGAAVAVTFVLYGNPRADQLEAELANRISEREELEFEVADLKLRNGELQSRLAQSLDRSLSMARYATAVGTTA